VAGSGRADFCQAGFLAAVERDGALRTSYRVMISAFKAAGSRRATVLFPLSHPPASPGLTSRTPARNCADGRWGVPEDDDVTRPGGGDSARRGRRGG